MDLAFTKMHGLGNDFVIVEDLAEELEFDADAIEWLCDRNFGIGADGLIIVRPATRPDADFFMAYHNADGQQAEMCGNGVRCFAKYVVDRGLLGSKSDSLVVDTLAGPKPITFTRDYCGNLYTATVDMGTPVLEAARIPTTLPCDTVFECPVDTELGTFRVTAVSMGNPHAIVWVDDVEEAPVETVGPLIENHPSFPQRTNVEFATVTAEDRIELRVWERGVGETLACGTGACATLVAAVLGKRIPGRFASIELPGGELAVTWSEEDDRVYMTGPATEVFSGIVPVGEGDGEED